jgi:general secretion pathway protein J
MRRSPTNAGFTLIEMLIATALMVAILTALASVTAQWLPNWNHGFARVQRTDLFSAGLERIITDLSAAQFVSGSNKEPIFQGENQSVRFVRTTVGPNSKPGLEVVLIAESADDRGLAMVRTRAPFVSFLADPRTSVSPSYTDPVALVRSPYRISFSYAGLDRIWRDTWRNSVQLPTAVRITVRDVATARTLSVSTATMIHVDTPPDCIRAKNMGDCGKPDSQTKAGQPPPESAR